MNETTYTTTGSGEMSEMDAERDAIRRMLDARYNGVIPVTDEMVSMVLAGLIGEHS